MANQFAGGPVELGTTVLGGILDSMVDPKSQTQRPEVDGQQDPRFLAFIGGEPRMTFKTVDLTSALAAAGLAGVSIASLTGGVKLYDARMAGVARGGSGTHTRAVATAGLVLPRTITMMEKALATIDYEAIPISSDGTTNPVTITTNANLPTAPTLARGFVLAKVVLNGSELGGIKGATLTPQIAEEVFTGGGVYPTTADARSKMPTLRLDTVDSSLLLAYQTPTEVTSLVIYLRKRGANGSLVADGTAEHIKFTIESGAIKAEAKSSGGGRASTMGLTVEPTHDGTNPIVSVDTASAIS